jgi:aspartyl-tRNA(Asn)/glutamyl-tRNA(Gln) amidotransferase subunit A
MPAEASSNLARYDGVKYGFSKNKNDLIENYLTSRGEGFGAEPTRRIMTGTYVLSAGYFDAYYKQAKIARAMIKEDFKKAFENIDIIMTPTAPTTAFKLGEKIQDPLEMYAADIFTVPVNIAGLPAISIPCGKANDLPVGLQMIAPWQKEEILFNVGEFFQDNYDA